VVSIYTCKHLYIKRSTKRLTKPWIHISTINSGGADYLAKMIEYNKFLQEPMIRY
jgi:hypothetical protein